MRKSFGLAVSAAAVGMIALAGCHSSGKVKSGLASASANPAVVQAEAKIKACVSQDLFKGKAVILACIAPAGSKTATEAALQADLASANLSYQGRPRRVRAGSSRDRGERGRDTGPVTQHHRAGPGGQSWLRESGSLWPS